jgi:hypothetical protein
MARDGGGFAVQACQSLRGMIVSDNEVATIVVPRRTGGSSSALLRRDRVQAGGAADGSRPHWGWLTRQGAVSSEVALNAPNGHARAMPLRSWLVPGANGAS